jgi:hypothetical protein
VTDDIVDGCHLLSLLTVVHEFKQHKILRWLFARAKGFCIPAQNDKS